MAQLEGKGSISSPNLQQNYLCFEEGNLKLLKVLKIFISGYTVFLQE